MEKLECQIMNLVDTVASSAASFSSHGYHIFVESREDLKRVISALCEKQQNKSVSDILRSK